MPDESLPQSQPPGSNGGTPSPQLEGVWLSSEEWAEATDIDMAFFAAIRCEDVDNPHKIELLKSVQIRYARFVARVDVRLNPA
ncbi:MAG: hypothetical protein V3T83_10445 [Acidobacteriota bacterium]